MLASSTSKIHSLSRSVEPKSVSGHRHAETGSNGGSESVSEHRHAEAGSNLGNLRSQAEDIHRRPDDNGRPMRFDSSTSSKRTSK